MTIPITHTLVGQGFAVGVRRAAWHPKEHKVYALDLIGSGTAIRAITASMIERPSWTGELREGTPGKIGKVLANLEADRFDQSGKASVHYRRALRPLGRSGIGQGVVWHSASVLQSPGKRRVALGVDLETAQAMHLRHVAELLAIPIPLEWAAPIADAMTGRELHQTVQLSTVGMCGYWTRPTDHLKTWITRAVQSGALTIEDAP